MRIVSSSYHAIFGGTVIYFESKTCDVKETTQQFFVASGANHVGKLEGSTLGLNLGQQVTGSRKRDCQWSQNRLVRSKNVLKVPWSKRDEANRLMPHKI